MNVVEVLMPFVKQIIKKVKMRLKFGKDAIPEPVNI